MIDRKLKSKLVSALDNFRIVMLNGPRQSGKTTLVKKIADELGMGYLSLDDPEKLNLSKEDPKNFLSFYAKKPLVIDEVQFAPGLIPYIKSFVDEINRRGMFLLTGSADFIRMHKVTESLAGRMVRYNLYPFAASELQAKKTISLTSFFPMIFLNLKTVLRWNMSWT